MRLLFVGKRRPQQRDLVTRPYGRFFHLPAELARRGHHITTLLCSHDGSDEVDAVLDGLRQRTVDLRCGLRRFLDAVDTAAAVARPHWVIGVSDAWYGPLAHRLAKRTGARLAIDAYDNYEAYMPWNVPLHVLWRRSVAHADLVTAAGPQLAERLARDRRATGVEVLPMAADPGFVPRDRAACRRELGLPPDAPLVGYAGSWSGHRGSEVMLDMFDALRRDVPDVRLVVSGRAPPHVAAHAGVIATGYLPDEQVPRLLPSLDVACIVTADTAFGRYSYPAKLCEALACRVPVVATATEAVAWMLGADAHHLVPVGDAATLAQRIRALLDAPRVPDVQPPRWPEVAARYDELLSR